VSDEYFKSRLMRTGEQAVPTEAPIAVEPEVRAELQQLRAAVSSLAMERAGDVERSAQPRDAIEDAVINAANSVLRRFGV
jgi:hypothetical protein